MTIEIKGYEPYHKTKCYQCEHFKEVEGSVYWHECTASQCHTAANNYACYNFKMKGGTK